MIAETAQTLAERDAARKNPMKQAVIDAVNVDGTVNLTMEGGVHLNVKCLRNLGIVPGTTVWVYEPAPGDRFVIGALARNTDFSTSGGVAEHRGAFFSDGIEIYHPTGQAYIDFHGVAAPDGEDYDVRIIYMDHGTANERLEVVVANGQVRFYDRGTGNLLIWHGEYSAGNGHLDVHGCYQGNGTTSSVRLRARGGNETSFGWDGTYRMWVDATNVKNFVIDHPLDPDRHLAHACLEGPTADVFYRGRGQLDASGHAWVTLPEYFDALTVPGSATVQVTPIIRDQDLGGFAYQEKVMQGLALISWLTSTPIGDVPRPPVRATGVPYLATTEVSNGAFIVMSAGGFVCPDAEFFWEVKAERKNAKFPVEPLRTEVEVMGDGPYTYMKEVPDAR